MIEITGLTLHQRNLLDSMWEKDTTEELYAWRRTLTAKNNRTVDVLMEMLELAYLDLEINCTSDLSLANKLIEKARKGVDR